jgi:hypothetical protein
MKTKNENKPIQREDGVWEFKTTTGVVIEIREGDGDDVVNATQRCEGETHLLLPILMAELCKFDGKELFPDQVRKLRMNTYMQAMHAFQEVNFS